MTSESISNEELQKIIEGSVFNLYPGSVPVNAGEPVTDGNGMSYPRTRVTYRNIRTTRGEFHLFGDVPLELQDFMPGKRFIIEEVYQNNDAAIPAVQHFRAEQEGGIAVQYQFRRE